MNPHYAIGRDIVKDDLESLIDRTSLSDVLEMLADIARDKADHLQTNWQDSDSARAWESAATAIDKTAARIHF